MTATGTDRTDPGLEATLRRTRERGRKLLVPFVTAGVIAQWTTLVGELAAAGADAVEIGLPFSDPMLEGAVIQRASQRALDRGMTTAAALEAISALDVPIPLIVMTYANLVRRRGWEPFTRSLAEAGVSGLIALDVPVEAAGPLVAAGRAQGVANVLLVAPSTPDRQVAEVARSGSGFVYASTVMGTTGERSVLGDRAAALATRVRAHTDRPVLLGFGISGPPVAAVAARAADGVVMGAALMRRLLDGGADGFGEAVELVGSVRRALDRL